MPLAEATTNKRVTQSDVARVASVHNTTVSLALRNAPSIPAATRQRIREIADQLGYRPDPTLQALVAYRKSQTTERRKETLAYITDSASRWGWRASPTAERLFVGAQRKAVELGYRLEHLWLGEAGMSARRLGDMLYHRAIAGVLLAAHDGGRGDWAEMEWSRLSAVQLGGCPDELALHRILHDHAGSVRLAFRRARAAGYERIGLVVDPVRDAANDHACSAGFLSEQNRLPADTRIPLLPLRTEAGACALATWFDEHRPEAVLSLSPSLPDRLAHLGLAIPRDAGYVDLSLHLADGAVAGVYPHSETTGEVAVAALAAHLQQNERGLPPVATTMLVAGTWFDGASLPVLRSGKRDGHRRAEVEGVLLASA